MRKLAIAAGFVALGFAAPVLAGGKGGSPSPGAFHQLASGHWAHLLFSPGSSSPGRHYGWTHGKHWGWFKPHNPHWPHQPPASP